jgi:DNA-binding winged helix-turn-helix (wHTH) protein/tetratricopeptide (TPR) repeat protein
MCPVLTNPQFSGSQLDRRICRLAESSSSSGPLYARFGEFELDELNARLLRSGTPLSLSPTPFKLLCALARRPGALLTKHALLDEVWGHRFVSDSVLKGAISDVRTVLGDDAQKPRFIETAPRRGYRFIAVASAPSPPPTRTVDAGTTTSESPLSGRPRHSSFVGRTKECASLERAWERASAGKRALLWIAGEPGIGKSTLIDHFVAGRGETANARGHCVQHYGSGEPYHPVLEALGDLCRTDAEAAPLLRAVAPTWFLQLPWLSTAEQRDALQRELVGVNQERMLRELGEFLDRYSEDQPLLLVTEDLHWSDRATIQLLDYFARRRSRCRVMWLASFRLAEVVASDQPLNTLRRELNLHGLCEELVLDSFSQADVAAYLAARAPSIEHDESFVRTLHERTEGVPLFVSSVTNEVARRADQGDMPAAALLASSPLPDSLFAIIDHYLAKLSDERRQLLSAAAVCGLQFSIETLARAIGRDTLWVADACDQLLREQVWLVTSGEVDPGLSVETSFAFRHALFRQALYDRLAPSARAAIHHKVGLALEEQQDATIPAAELAMHFDRGRVPLSALRYYGEAAAAALHVSPSECMSLTERALGIADRAPPSVDRDSHVITLATLRGAAAFHVLGAGEEARRAYLRGFSLLDNVPKHPMRALLLHGFGFLLNLRAEYAEALNVAARAEALASGTEDSFLSLSASATRAVAHMHQGRPQSAFDWLDSARPAAEAISAAAQEKFVGFIADPQVAVLATLSLQLMHLGRVAEARDCLQRAYARARRIAQPMALLFTMWFDALCTIRLGEVARVAALADEMQALVETFGLAQGKFACRFFRGWSDARRGKPLDAFAQIRTAYEQNTALGMISGGSETLGYAAEALMLHGDLDGADEQLRQALEIVNNFGERIYLPQLLLLEASIARARGLRDRADASAQRAITEARAQSAPWLELLALTDFCEHSTANVVEHRALEELVTRMSQGVDAPALTRAKTVLELRRAS